MKRLLFMLLLGVFVASSANAQDRRITRFEREPNYLAFRIGAWFPKDQEKEFTFNDITYENAKSQIDQSQAIGLELEYQNLIAFPLFLDFSIGGWYSTYSFKFTEILQNPSDIRQSSSWAVVMPVTLGLAFHPLPRNPIQPYVMVGAGASFGFSGMTVEHFELKDSDENRNDIVFGWFAGAGFDFLFSPSLGASLGVKYNSVKFDEPLLTQQQDFTGLSISLGISVAQAYLD